jgi:hypothetical protein
MKKVYQQKKEEIDEFGNPFAAKIGLKDDDLENRDRSFSIQNKGPH